MKYTLNTFLFILFFVAAQAQKNSLREVVAIVRPVYSESTVTFLNSFADRMSKQGYDSLSVQLKRYAKGNSFGSGFAYMSPTDSQTYILTNRHVVAQAQFVNVEFALEDQSVKSFTNCKIVSVDFENDLALISLPQGVKLDRILNISPRKAEDAEDVFTAGYPGLGDKASWQLGKGIVSNSSIHMDEWIPSKNSIIQHTAQIDPGSSGGPLLRRNPSAPRGYEIVGMNTWKVSDRENANFSIQASVIQHFIDAYLKGDNKLSKENLQKQAMDFIGVAKDGYKSILPYVSYEYIANISPSTFFELYGSATPELKKVVKKQFENQYPMEAVRIIISSIISDKMSKKSLEFESIENFSSTGSVVVNMKEGTKIVKTTWISDQGLWRISDVASIKFGENKTVRIDRSYGYDGSFTYVKNFDMGHSGFSFFEVLTQRTIKTFFTSGLGIYSGKMYLEPTDDSDVDSYSFWGLETTYGAQVPVKIGPVHIVPFARALVGADLGSISEMTILFNYGYRVGVEANVHLTGDTYLITGIGFRKRMFLLPGDTTIPGMGSFSLSIGISY